MITMLKSEYRGWKGFIPVAPMRPDFRGRPVAVQQLSPVPSNGNGRRPVEMGVIPAAPVRRVTLQEAVAASNRHPRFPGGIIFLGSRDYPQFGIPRVTFPDRGPVIMVRVY